MYLWLIFYDSAIPLLVIYLKEYKLSYTKDTCTPVCSAALFTIANYGNSQIAPQLINGLRKIRYLYTMDLYSAIKNEILSFADKWVELENIILSEFRWVQKAKGHVFSLICGI
jgi:hypothetical protein